MEDFVLRLSVQVPGFLMAIVFHEAAHAFVASRFGDPTARGLGRITLNPSAHIDPIGTVLFPLIGAAMGGFMFGWAKPVPVDPRHFKNVRVASFWVSFAGPLANIILAMILAFFLAILITKVSPDFYFFSYLAQALKQAVAINMILAAFNLIPFPPLDGSKMLSSFLSFEALRKYEELSRYSFMFFILLMFTGALRYVLVPAITIGEGMIGLFHQILI